MNNKLEPKRVYARALDPIHIGAGGYRLGRVDNTIVRDPATDVPKIPGTSIAGVVRTFAEIVKEEDKKKEEKQKFRDVDIESVFGSKPGENKTEKGILQFYDGQIILFPVSSIQGTVWITTKELLGYWFGEIKDKNRENIKIPDEIGNEAYAIKGIDTDRKLNPREKNTDEYLNLGWLLLEVKKPEDGKEIALPQKIDNWVKRIVVVSDKLFSHIVNDNLEVRTSVRIDPETGTAAEGALFAYEAIPRGAVLGFEIGVDKALAKQKDIDTDVVDKIISAVSPYLRNLGIGGMGTRGFGRLEIDLGNNNGNGGETDAQS